MAQEQRNSFNQKRGNTAEDAKRGADVVIEEFSSGRSLTHVIFFGAQNRHLFEVGFDANHVLCTEGRSNVGHIAALASDCGNASGFGAKANETGARSSWSFPLQGPVVSRRVTTERTDVCAVSLPHLTGIKPGLFYGHRLGPIATRMSFVLLGWQSHTPCCAVRHAAAVGAALISQEGGEEAGEI